MDGFGYQAEAASLWRQVILMLKQQFNDAPSEYRVHLGVSWEQYGVYLSVCGRQGDARIAEGEAAAHGDILCNAGISTFITPTPTYYRYRRRSLYNFGKYSAACADAAKFVEYCRGLYRSEGVQHVELLALALLWHYDCLVPTRRNSDANACVDEAVLLMQAGGLLEGEVDLSISQSFEPLPYSPPLPRPLRFKHPLTRQFSMSLGADDDRAITVTARAVVCARELFQISPTEHSQLLAQTLWHHGNALHNAQKYKAACSAKAEAVNITRERCLLHPGKYENDLASHLQGYGDSLQCRGMYKAASEAKAEAVNITRELCLRHPGKYEHDLAWYLQGYGHFLRHRGMYETACDSMAGAVTATRELCQLHPGKYQHNLRWYLEEYGDSLRRRGMYEAACDSMAEVVTITRELCRLHPGTNEHALPYYLHKYGNLLQRRGMHEAACDAMAEAVNIARERCQLDPGTDEAGLAYYLRVYGRSLRHAEKYNAARDATAEAADIIRELCQLHPGDEDLLMYYLGEYDALLHARELHAAARRKAACGGKLGSTDAIREL